MPDYSTSDSLPDTLYDVVIVGSGVVGCAMARRFALEGANVLVLEKAVDILDGASKANSAILHTGFDAPAPGSQEHTCIVDGYNEYLEIHARLNLPLLECGAMVLAWNEAEAGRLEQILQDAHRNGVTAARIINSRQVLAKEPKLANSVVSCARGTGRIRYRSLERSLRLFTAGTRKWRQPGAKLRSARGKFRRQRMDARNRQGHGTEQAIDQLLRTIR